MYFVEKDGRKRVGTYANCGYCKRQYITRADQPAKYCSKKCADDAKKNRTTAICAYCKKSFSRRVNKLKYSRSGLYFCTRACKDEAQTIKEGCIREIMPSHFKTGRHSYRERYRKQKLSCSRCGYNEFQCSVHIHHKDHNRDNNDPSNLVPLCACCHKALHENMWIL